MDHGTGRDGSGEPAGSDSLVFSACPWSVVPEPLEDQNWGFNLY